MKGLPLQMKKTGVGRQIEVRNTFTLLTCMDFCGKKVDSISVAP